MNSNTKKYLIGGGLVIAIAIALFTSISGDNMTYYRTPAEILASPDDFMGEKIRVMGLIETGSVTWEPKDTKLGFRITEDGQHFLDVSYVGSKPDMFKEGQGVVVEGKLTGPGQLTATKLLVKHSEEYKVEKHSDKKADYYKSMAQ